MSDIFTGLSSWRLSARDVSQFSNGEMIFIQSPERLRQHLEYEYSSFCGLSASIVGSIKWLVTHQRSS
jgi:hypothetical protein